MKRAIGRPTKIQQAYQDAARDLGCVICRWLMETGRLKVSAGQCGATEIHHRNLDDKHGQKQLGQSQVVSLCSWHHSGTPPEYWGNVDTDRVYGTSFKYAKPFRAWTAELHPDIPGRGTEVWQAVQDRMLIAAGYGELVEAVRGES